MDDHALEKLQFHRVLDELARHCACEVGRQFVARIRPSNDPETIGRWLDQVRELIRLADEFGAPPLAGLHDIRGELEQASKPAGLDGEQLAKIQSTLSTLTLLRLWINGLPEDGAQLKRMSPHLHDFSELARIIDETIDSRGKVRDEASQKLANLRRQISDLTRKARGIFDRVLKQRRYHKMLQYVGVTFHDDRYVLPLKAEHRGRIPGIIHRSSRSGGTVFVEPAEAVEINNTIIRLRLKADEEIRRILNDLARQVHRKAGEITEALHTAGQLDVIAAKRRYAAKHEAGCPQINLQGILNLQQARHPILLELSANSETQQVVPIDVRLGDDFDVLVITGPNTGGKTVAVKTIGLCVALTQAGIPIPASSHSTVPVFNNLFIDVGDEQSIEQSLSTFSGHLSNILVILKQADQDSLVLLDELGAGTDPDEGAAIGRAVLDELLTIGCCAALTTHLSVLKEVAYSQPRVDNASVEFDPQTLQPTYHLRIGEPGNSNAITIAERLGMPPRMIQQARRHLSDRERALSRAIEGTLATRRAAEQARKDALRAEQQAHHERQLLQDQANAMQAERQRFEKWLAWVNQLRAGHPAYVKSLGRNATIVRMSLHQQRAVVSRGAIEYDVQLPDLDFPVDEVG